MSIFKFLKILFAGTVIMSLLYYVLNERHSKTSFHPVGDRAGSGIEVGKNEVKSKERVLQQEYFSMKDMEKHIDVFYYYDETNKTHEFIYQNHEFKVLDGSQLAEKDGKLISLHDPLFEKKQLKLQAADWEDLFNIRIYQENKALYVDEQGKRADAAEKKSYSKQQLIEKLKEASVPIKGARLTTVSGQLPMAPRSYRNGMHEGVDWYSGSPVAVTKKTDVFPILSGHIIRIDHHYQELSRKEREELLEIAAKEKTTPAYIIDQLRGRQVWIQSENGVVVRYAHLNEVNPSLKVGQRIEKKQAIGKSGNSGTSNGVLNTNEDVHLHLDILVDGVLYWEYLDGKNEAYEVLKEIFK